MKVGSLFAGIGGFDLAARWVGWETSWYSEIEPYASGVMAKHFPQAVKYGDITKIDGRSIEPVDLLCGGFPCQDISLAGKGEGITGARSGLWTHYARLIDEIRPRWVVAENVSALRSRGLDKVLGDLMALGYDAEWHCIPAAYVGAPHRRDRIWIIAYPSGGGFELRLSDLYAWQSDVVGGGALDSNANGRRFEVGSQLDRESIEDSADRDSCGTHTDGLRDALANAGQQSEHESDDEGKALGDSRNARLEPRERGDRLNVVSSEPAVADSDDQGLEGHDDGQGTALATGAVTADAWAEAVGDGAGWWATEPDVGRVAHGVPARVDRLRCLGNAIVPQVAYLIFQAIAAEEARQDALRLPDLREATR